MRQLRSPVVPLEGGTLKLAVPPEISDHLVEIRYVLYQTADGFFFDFVGEDVSQQPEAVQAWLWQRKKVLEWMLVQRVKSHLRGPMLPPEVDVH